MKDNFLESSGFSQAYLPFKFSEITYTQNATCFWAWLWEKNIVCFQWTLPRPIIHPHECDPLVGCCWKAEDLFQRSLAALRTLSSISPIALFECSSGPCYDYTRGGGGVERQYSSTFSIHELRIEIHLPAGNTGHHKELSKESLTCHKV